MPGAVPKAWCPRRGEVYWVSLDEQRPALILSTNALNRHSLDVCIVPITSVQHAEFSLRVPISAGDGGLKRPSWAKCDQVTTVEQGFLVYPPVGTLSPATLHRIEGYVKAALELP